MSLRKIGLRLGALALAALVAASGTAKAPQAPATLWHGGTILTMDGDTPQTVQAVVERRLSLLPAGITSVTGVFVAGDPVDLLDENGNTVARGLVNFDSTELPGLLGRSTRDLARELGPAYEREVVHRDDLVVLRP